MCGLVGVAGKLEFKDEALMKRLLIFDYFRGTDSTGFARLKNNFKEFDLIKMASHPIDLFDSKKFSAALNGNQSSVFLGHNRAATLGKVNGLNAHPFHFDNIVGAHNGTLTDQSWKDLDKLTGEQTDVDSAAIFAAIAKSGIKKAVGEMTEGLNPQRGAWALTWFDMEDGTLNFLRNKHRPLWYAWTKELDKIIWASQYPMIEAAVDLAKEDIQLWEDKDGNSFFEFQENVHYCLDLEELRTGNKNNPMKMKVKELPGKKLASSYTCGNGSNSHGNGGGNNGAPPFRPNKNGSTLGYSDTQTRNGTNNSQTTSQDKPIIDNIDVVGSEQYPYGGYIDKADWEAMAKGGCWWCMADLNYGEAGQTVMERQDAILCPDCSAPSHETIRILCDPEAFDQAVSRNSVTARM